MDDSRPGRFQFSTRSLILATVVVACLLVPVVWVERERRAMLAARQAILAAREVAMRSVLLEQSLRQREREQEEEREREKVIEHDARSAPAVSAGATDIERLKRENAELKREVRQLRQKLELLGTPLERPESTGR